MELNILQTIKTLLGIIDTAFDEDISVHINSAFMVLNQLGVGPDTVFSIVDGTETWSHFITDVTTYQAVKSYVYLYVRILFDPPSSSFILDALKNQKAEMEWRLNVQVPIPPEA